MAQEIPVAFPAGIGARSPAGRWNPAEFPLVERSHPPEEPGYHYSERQR